MSEFDSEILSHCCATHRPMMMVTVQVASSKEVNSFLYFFFVDVSVFISCINKIRCVVFEVVQLVGHEENIDCRCVVLSESERSVQCQSPGSVKQKSGAGLCSTVSDKNQKIMSGVGGRQPLMMVPQCGPEFQRAVGLCAHESHRPDWGPGPDMPAQCMVPRWRSLET